MMLKTASTLSFRTRTFGSAALLVTLFTGIPGCSDNAQSSGPENQSTALSSSTEHQSAGSQADPVKPDPALASVDPATTGSGNVNSSTDNAQLSDEKRHTLGRRSFLQCRACHTLKKGEANLVGPNLFGLFGSKVAFKEDFNYSTALSSTGVTWNDETLKSWLRNPKQFAPGTLMVFDGVKDEQKLSYLIDYMRVETRP